MATPKTKAVSAPIATSVAINPIFGFKKYEAREMEELGTLKDNFGDDFQLGYNPANFRRYQNGVDKNLYVIVQLENGESTTISCSQAVSELLASGDITLSHLMEFPMLTSTYDNAKGETVTRPVITIPTDGSSRTQFFNAKDAKKVSFAGITQTFKAPAW